jgi:hypothetical protein
MRTNLKKQLGNRSSYSGIVSRYGSKKNWHGFPEPTILLVDVKDDLGNLVADHLWFKVGKRIVGIRFQTDRLAPGESYRLKLGRVSTPS